MITVLDKETNMRLIQAQNNLYLVSMLGEAKASIETIPHNDDVLLKFLLQKNCTANELTQILDRFSNHFLAENLEVSGLLLRGDEDEMLTNIGFTPLTEESDFLYKKNLNKVKEGRRQK